RRAGIELPQSAHLLFLQPNGARAPGEQPTRQNSPPTPETQSNETTAPFSCGLQNSVPPYSFLRSSCILTGLTHGPVTFSVLNRLSGSLLMPRSAQSTGESFARSCT